MRGLLITFEGIEGSGKTTLMELVASSLDNAVRMSVLTREPGGTYLGLSLRRVLLDQKNVEISPMAELMMFAADRAQHVTEVIIPNLENGRIVLCDRFSDATAAYQGFGRGIPIEAVHAVDGWARDAITPHMTVLLDLPVEVGLARVRARNNRIPGHEETRIDDEDRSFHQRVRDGYLQLAQEDPERFFLLDATREPELLAGQVIKELKKRFPDEV